jgi:hypothetical protein
VPIRDRSPGRVEGTGDSDGDGIPDYLDATDDSAPDPDVPDGSAAAGPLSVAYVYTADGVELVVTVTGAAAADLEDIDSRGADVIDGSTHPGPGESTAIDVQQGDTVVLQLSPPAAARPARSSASWSTVRTGVHGRYGVGDGVRQLFRRGMAAGPGLATRPVHPRDRNVCSRLAPQPGQTWR